MAFRADCKPGSTYGALRLKRLAIGHRREALHSLEIFSEEGLGPYTEFSCYARWLIDERRVDLLEIHESGEPMIQDTQSGFGAIIGYEFANGLAIDVSYRLCCFNILQPNTSQGVSMYPQSVSLGLAYKFGKK